MSDLNKNLKGTGTSFSKLMSGERFAGIFEHIRKSGAVKVAGQVAGQALLYADVPMVGYQVGSIASDMGASSGATAALGVGASVGTYMGLRGVSKMGMSLLAPTVAMGSIGAYSALQIASGYAKGGKALRRKRSDYIGKINQHSLSTEDRHDFVDILGDEGASV